VWSGVAITTPSMPFSFSSIWRKSAYLPALANISLSFVASGRTWPSRLGRSLLSTFVFENAMSGSHTATRFSVFASSCALPDPIPPKPATAKFTVSLGARYPGPPSTCRGTIVGNPRDANAAAAAVVPVSTTKVRREIFFLRAMAASRSAG
jgi:hypothetical protein